MTLQGNKSGILQLHGNTARSRSNERSENRAANYDEVSRRAYELYLERGGLPGKELEDWLQAEHEIESAAHVTRATIGEKHRP